MDISKLIPASKSADDCYRAGWDYALNGANVENCHFAFFTSPERTAQWEKGAAAARQAMLAAREGGG